LATVAGVDVDGNKVISWGEAGEEVYFIVPLPTNLLFFVIRE
jgi:hypothetical protein